MSTDSQEVHDVLVRPERPDEAAAVRRVVEAAFGDDGRHVADLVKALVGHRAASLVAEQPGGTGHGIVGHVQLSRSWVDARQGLVEVLVLSPLAVVPDLQQRGIGTALVEAAAQAADDLGAPALFLEGDPGYYGRRGFVAGRGQGFERPSVRIPEPAFQVRLLAAYEPWMRGALVYCEPFWALDAVGLRDPVLAAIEQALQT